MNMKLSNVISTLYSWKIRILAVIIIAVFLSNMYVDGIQTSGAQTIIKFNDSVISNGVFPDGRQFDANEISTPKVIQRVVDKLGISRTVDDIRSHITITPIIPDSITEIKEAKEKDGEKFEYFPSTFTVKYSGFLEQSPSEVRDILDTVIQEYTRYYSEKYGTFAGVYNEVGDEDISKYDYIEQADIISDNVDDILASLEGCNSGITFRSARTGMSFGDLISEYNHLKNFTISELYAEIYKGKVAENKDIVIQKYLQKEADMLLEKKNHEDAAQMIKERMDAFSTANKDVPNAYNYPSNNTNNDNLEIIDYLHKSGTPSEVETTYDELITSYTESLVAADSAALSAGHYREIAEKFMDEADESVDTESVKAKVIDLLASTLKRMNELYKLTEKTIEDYNDKNSSVHIGVLTGVKCYENESKSLYMIIAVILSVGLVVTLAVTLEFLKAYKKEENADEEKEEERSL